MLFVCSYTFHNTLSWSLEDVIIDVDADWDVVVVGVGCYCLFHFSLNMLDLPIKPMDWLAEWLYLLVLKILMSLLYWYLSFAVVFLSIERILKLYLKWSTCKGLPYSHCTQSRLVCYMSGSPLNENNHPMMLPNGYVYGEQVSRLVSQLVSLVASQLVSLSVR